MPLRQTESRKCGGTNMSERGEAEPALQGQVALVTGSSRGIGRAIALELGRLGASVCVNYRGSEKQAHEVVEQLHAQGNQAVAIGADVSRAEDVERLFKEITNTLGAVTILV